MTENNPGLLQETTDQPTLTTPGSRDKYLASVIEQGILKRGHKVDDYIFVILGISYVDGLGVAPCFIKEEQYGEDCTKTYHGDIEEFVERLLSYKQKIPSGNRKLIGVFYREKRIDDESDNQYLKWDPKMLGPRVIHDFI